MQSNCMVTDVFGFQNWVVLRQEDSSWQPATNSAFCASKHFRIFAFVHLSPLHLSPLIKANNVS